jgi:hypothetical protein
VKTDSPERVAALDALRREFNLPEGTPLGGGGGRGGRRAAGAPAATATPNPCARGARGEGGGAAAGRGAAGAQGAGRGGRGNALAALSDDQRAALQAKLDAVNQKLPPAAARR